MTRIKICGLTRQADVDCAVECGADALGFVLEPSSSRYVGGNADLRAHLNQLPPFVVRVGVFAQFRPTEELTGLDAVQALDAHVAAARNCRRILTLRPAPDVSIERCAEMAQSCCAVLVDAYDPRSYGGTGKLFDFDFAQAVREAIDKPLILAGGLDPMNVAEIVRRLKPYGVDVSSGVEALPGAKDAEKIHRFIEEVRNA